MAKKRASKSQTPLLWHDDLPEVEAKVEAKVEVKVKVKIESDVPPPTPSPSDAMRRDATQEEEKGGSAEPTTEVEPRPDGQPNNPPENPPDNRPSLILDSESKRPPKREKSKPEVETFSRNSLPDVIIESRFLVSDEEWEAKALEIVKMPAGMYRELWKLEGEWIGWGDT